MSIVIESPKLMAIRLTRLSPKSNKNNFVYTYSATLDVTAQLHSGTTGFFPSQYDGRDINVGDYIATSSQGRVLKISELISVGPTRIECILVDEDQINAATDSTQYGESAIDTDDGILFELREGKPYLFPLPDILPGGLTEEFAIQIATRFNFAGKEKNINVEQLPNTFVLGETVTLSSTGWSSDTTDPTGVVVKADDDSFSVRLFGTKTYMELPGNVGDIYFWDPVDRILTTTPTSAASVKLFQKLGSKEALLLDSTGAASTGTGNGSGGFGGNYNDLFNKPVIPTDVSQLQDASGLLQHATRTSDLTNDSNFVTQAYVDSQVAGVSGGGAVDLTGYATTTDITNLANTVTLGNAQTLLDANAYADSIAFSGDYNNLINKPSIPSVTGLASTAYVDTQIASIGDLFSGDYNNLINKPSIPSVTGLASTAYVDAQIASVQTFSGNYADLNGKPTLFLGNYNELYNTPAIPANTSELINDAGFLTNITQSQVYTALGFTPQNAATAFSGDYNSLANKPSIPSIAGLASTAYVDQQIANVATGGTVDLSGYVTDTQLATELAAYQPTVDLSAYASTAYVDAQIANINTTGNVDLTGYATEQWVTNALLNVGAGISELNQLNDVAIDGTETNTHALMFNSLSNMWENVDLTENWASKDYVTAQLLSFSTNGTIDLEGYASETWVDQRILERGPHFSGDYNDLVNRPALFSGDYNDLTNTPENQIDQLSFTLVGSTLQLSNGAQINLSALPVSYATLTNKPVLFSGSYTDLKNKPTLFSGNYLDLSNKPYIPSIAGLASEDYVNNKHAEPNITGDRNFTHNVEFQGTTNIVASTVDTVAEHKNLVMALQTTDATITEAVFKDGSRVVIAPNSTAMFEVYIVGATATDQYGVKLKGIINNTSGIVTLVGQPNRETLAQTDTAWAADVAVDSTNKSLKITVVGSAGTTIDWTVFCEINAVKR
jgi:hypothetical protein